MIIFSFSSRILADSRIRTISLRVFLAINAILLTLALTIGILIGCKVSLSEDHFLDNSNFSAEKAAHDLHSLIEENNRFLMEYIGKLSAKLVQLELKSKILTTRLDATRKFEIQMQVREADIKGGRIARTPPGKASGGPILPSHTIMFPAIQPVSEAMERLLLQEKQKQARIRSRLQDLQSSSVRIDALLSSLNAAATTVNQIHMLFPGRSPLPNSTITSRFGERSDPFHKQAAFHSGIDFAATTGTPVLASAGGRVIFAGFRGDYGYTVEIDHGDGLVTRYAHSSEVLVQDGDVVIPGEEIARVGSTGRSTGAHLHFEIMKDKHFIDPAIYLKRFLIR